MSNSRIERPDTDAVLDTLKDFQRSTVEYVFQRMYLDDPPARRFLVADEVGLGKTLVARGLIAKTVDHLWEDVGRIDVVYVCANSHIARQNIKRLSIQADAKVALASRLTLLPVTLPDISKNKLNFVAFTPGTSFNLRSSEGMRQERALLYHLLHDFWQFGERKGPFRALQGWVGDSVAWRREVARYARAHTIDEGLQRAYIAALTREDLERQQLGQSTLRDEFERIAERLSHIDYIPYDVVHPRANLVGRLREILAQTCLDALEPDLVILDEFQRFRHLLRDDDEVAHLARSLFNYVTPEGQQARVLLLSATPYKMYTQHFEGEDDHYRDFMETVKFLHEDPERTRSFQKHLDEYRSSLLHLSAETVPQFKRAKDEVEADLRRVMVRNERLQVSSEPLPMVQEVPRTAVRLEVGDLRHFMVLDQVAARVGVGDHVEYWKSAPYLANFMEAYVLKKGLRRAANDDALRSELGALATRRPEGFLQWSEVEEYAEIDPSNARLRALIENEVARGWRLLWLPPSLPYYEGGEPFDSAGAASITKVLVFSSWKVVPKVVATMASLEAERRMVRTLDPYVGYSRLHLKRRPLLRFAEQERRVARTAPGEPTRRLSGMPVLTLLYPSATLATLIDPLAIAADLRAGGRQATMQGVIDVAAEQLRPLLERIVKEHHREAPGVADEAWYWSALAQLDGLLHPASTIRWLDSDDDKIAWRSMVRTLGDDDTSLFDLHVREFRRHVDAPSDLGRPPDDLPEVLAQIAVASPAVCALRSLIRLWPEARLADAVAARSGAARAAMSFRSVFNLPESITLIRGSYLEDENDLTPYWRLCLRYALNGNLQAVLDEYVHVLRDALGLFGGEPAHDSGEIMTQMAEAASIRTVRLEFDELDPSGVDESSFLRSRTLRCRYAMRFGRDQSEDGSQVTREDQVRAAFNSPFRPFVVATTSIGQEGIDFHWYCHRIYHWNLPSNPVDLEQREGRIDRYKGHAIRRNVALRHGDEFFAEAARRHGAIGDPWRRMFEMARTRRDRDPRANELDPWWVYRVPHGSSVERFVPILPLSRDEAVLTDLKDSLVAYRLVFGQPGQEDLLEFLKRRVADQGLDLERLVHECRVDLSAPNGRGA